MKFKPLANPILLVSDNPSLPGGLARMCRDLATLCCTLPQFRVAVLGRGMGQRRKFPFVLYDYPEIGQWGQDYIQQVWEDFSGGENGVVLTLDDASRRHWFSNPVGLPPALAKFLGSGRNFEKWMYLPVDSTGPNGVTLPQAGIDCVSHYDRVLAASEWGRDVLITGGRMDADWLPHGYLGRRFYPYNMRGAMGWDKGIRMGCVMANQSRKDYPAAFECFAALKAHYGNQFNGWIHTDELIRYWNIPALASEYGVGDCLEVTTSCNDSDLAMRYSACDCTILPSAGEGFGYPILESLACGTPCVVTDYAGGTSLVDPACRVAPVAYRIDTQHCVMRAVLDGHRFAEAAMPQIEEKRRDWAYKTQQMAESVQHLEWSRLKYPWCKWLLEGLR